jgi:hypothetical protein
MVATVFGTEARSRSPRAPEGSHMTWLRAALLAWVASTAVSAQAPGAGWVVKPSPPREIQQIYWDLHKTTEAWTRLELRRPTGIVAPVELVVQATWPGARRTAAPATITLLAQGSPVAVLSAPTFVLTISRDDGTEQVTDLTLPPFQGQVLYPCPDCGFNAVESRVPPSVLLELTQASRLSGSVLGIDVELQPEDIDALRAFARHVGLAVP